MSVPGATLGLVLLAATAVAAEGPGGAPLQSSKQELKTLQADQTAKNNGAAAGEITAGMPQMSTPSPGEIPLDLNSSIKTEKELKKKKDTQKNWLLDGMDELGQSAKADKRAHPKDGAKDEGRTVEDKAGSAGPNYLLKLYSEQKKNDEAKTEARKARDPRNDPLAPFLQGWMAGSPAQVKSSNGFARMSESGNPGAGPALPALGPGEANLNQSASGVAEADGSSHHAGAGAQSNPYLPVPDTGALPDPGAGRSQSSGRPAALSGPAGGPPVATLTDPIPAGRPAEKKPQRLRPSDNDKYFPQQKKF